jgi:uncharacterized protein YkwD
MDFESYFDFIKKVFSLIPFNVFDYVVLLSLSIYAFEDASFGIIAAGISLTSTVAAFFLGLILYHPVSEILSSQFSLTKGISDAIAFLAVSVLSFILISGMLALIRKRYVYVKFPKKIDAIGGAILGTISFFFIASFAVALLLSFPVSEVIKESIRGSVTGRFLFTRTYVIESQVKNIFGGAVEDTINFLTIKPGSNEIVNLHFSIKSFKVDERSENQMLVLVNAEREKRGLPSVIIDERLRDVAREHAKDMLERGYFSHYTPEGLSPFDRIEASNIAYGYAGENLAFAPDVQIAMDGLMKSQGHRENILSANFGKAGIGVIDAGVFGKMFVQEFTD